LRAQHCDRRSDRQQEAGRQMVEAEARARSDWQRRRRRLVGRGEGVGVEVQFDRRIDLGEQAQQVPRVPPDPGHVLEERERVDPDREHLVAVDRPPPLPPHPGGQGAGEVAREVAEERQGDGEPPCHDRESVHQRRTRDRTHARCTIAAMDAVRVARDGPVAVLEMARPETGNALDGALVEALVEALTALPGSGARAAVLSGAGRHFSTGANLSELAPDAPLADRLADARRLGDLYATLLRCPLLTVAAVVMARLGGGFGLAAACDLHQLPDARPQFSGPAWLLALISVFLPRRVVGTRLAQLFFDPSPLGAAAAQAVGLVDEVADDPLTAARTRARSIAGRVSPSALAETKRLLLDQALPDLDERLAHAARVNAEQRADPECRRGVAAFLATRTFPDWLDDD
jgi:enoyl-CoA hydratase/carnithine racemase